MKDPRTRWDRLYRTADFPKEVYPDVIEIADFFKTKDIQRVLDIVRKLIT